MLLLKKMTTWVGVEGSATPSRVITSKSRVNFYNISLHEASTYSQSIFERPS